MKGQQTNQLIESKIRNGTIFILTDSDQEYTPVFMFIIVIQVNDGGGNFN